MKNRLFKLSIFGLAIISILFLMRSDVSAAITGKIAGTIVDAATNEPLPGVNVMVEGTTLGAATLPTGAYFILGVPPGVYAVTASIIGYQKMSTADVRVLVDRTTTVDFKLKSTAIESKEAIIVTAVRPAIIKDLTATAAQVDAQVFQSAPIQDARDLINLNAGILRDVSGNIIIRGGEYNQLKFYVDGVSMEQMDFRELGSRDVVRGQTAKFQFNILGVQEMEVVTGGFNAEYGDAQSGIVNIVTKEGGGAYHGEFRVEYSPPGKYHYGPYWYDNNTQLVYQEWGTIEKFQAWNAKRQVPLTADSLAKLFEMWKHTVNPSSNPDHYGGAYDYRKLTYKRANWGIGGPIVSNKLSFFFSGELRANPSLVASSMKYFNFYNLDFQSTYRITPKMKLKGKVFAQYYQNDRVTNEHNVWDGYSRSSAILLANHSIMQRPTSGEAIIWTHTINPTTFYEILVSHIQDQKKSRDFDQGQPASYAWWFRESALLGGMDFPGGAEIRSGNIADMDIDNYRYKVDLVSQVDPHNQIKAGSEGRMYWGYTQTMQTFGFVNYNEARAIASTHYTTPRYFGGYIQDKMEYGGMIANIGVRVDYYDANKPAPVDPFNPGYFLMNQDIPARGNFNVRDNKTHTKLSPRVGFSHPISENTAFHFQYGHFYQAPEENATDNFGTYGHGCYMQYYNPDLGPGKTVQYEFGIQHNLQGTHRINLVMYYNDLSDQPRQIRYKMPIVGNSADSYFTYVFENIGYGTAKGFELTFDRTAVGKWYYRVTYTLARVFTGTYGFQRKWSNDPTDINNWNNRQDSRTFLRGTDRAHRITGILSFRSPQDWGKIWGNWDIGMNWMIQSGTPYTYTRNYEESLTLINNRRYPIEQQTDLEIRKWIPVGRIRPQIFLRVYNLLNNKWMISGGSTWLERNRIYTDYRYWGTQTTAPVAGPWDDTNYRNNNYKWWYNMSRRLYLGIGFDF